MDFKRQIENHLFVIIAGAFVTGVSMTWIVSNEVLVKPREYDLQRQKELVEQLTKEAERSGGNSQARTPNDSLSAASLKPLTLEIVPNISKKNLDATLKKLRAAKKLRDLTPLESGNPVSQTPAGTHFFLSSDDCEIRNGDLNPLWNWTRVNRISKYRNLYFEFFLLAEKQAALVAFVSDDAVAEISKLDGKTVRRVPVSPTAWRQMTNLVLIPLERIAEATEREVSIREFDAIHLLDVTIQ